MLLLNNINFYNNEILIMSSLNDINNYNITEF